MPAKKSLREQFEAVKQNAQVYDFSVWIVDLDVIILEKQVHTFNAYQHEIAENNLLRERVHVFVNSPSLEFWFLQHVKDTGKYYAECTAVIAELKKYHPLKNYAKSEKYFIRTTPNIYDRLRPHLEHAIAAARKRGCYDPENPRRGVAELYKLFELLEINK